MDALFHFLFAIIAGMAIGLHKKHGLLDIIVISFVVNILIDIDHFIFDYPRALHNIFVVFFLPLILFIIFHFVERGKSIKLRSYILIAFVMLAGHILTDLLTGEIRLFYPLSNFALNAPSFILNISKTQYMPLIAKEGIVLLIYMIIIFPAYYIERLLYSIDRKRTGLKVKSPSGR